MEIKFTDVVQRAIACMNERILNAPNEEDRPIWNGFGGNRWFSAITVTRERTFGKDAGMEVVRRTVRFKHNNVGVASIILEGIYHLDADNNRASRFACWDIYSYSYARRYSIERGPTDGFKFQDIPHNGATLLTTMR